MNLALQMAGTDGWPSRCLHSTSMGIVLLGFGLLLALTIFHFTYDTCGGVHILCFVYLICLFDVDTVQVVLLKDGCS